jgi:iron complex transport system substrate-binding protein
LRLLLLAICLLSVTSCIRHNDVREQVDPDFDTGIDHFKHKLSVNYAKYFSVKYHNFWKEVDVYGAEGEKPIASFALVMRGAPVVDVPEGLTIIRIPVASVGSISTTHLPMLEALGDLENLKAFGAYDYLNNDRIRSKLDQSAVARIGQGGKIVREEMLASGIEILYTYPFGNDANDGDLAGVVSVPVCEYLESSPLAAAEWLKFFALFTNKEAEAEAFFQEEELAYQSLKKQIIEATKKPLVFTGLPWKNQWNMPSGSSAVAELLADAGARYVYASRKSSGNLTLSMEEVLGDAIQAHAWLIVSYFNGKTSSSDLLATDQRFGRFQAFKTGAVYLCDLSTADYFGDAVLRPSLLLADIMHWLHGIPARHQSKFFKKMN